MMSVIKLLLRLVLYFYLIVSPPVAKGIVFWDGFMLVCLLPAVSSLPWSEILPVFPEAKEAQGKKELQSNVAWVEFTLSLSWALQFGELAWPSENAAAFESLETLCLFCIHSFLHKKKRKPLLGYYIIWDCKCIDFSIGMHCICTLREGSYS